MGTTLDDDCLWLITTHIDTVTQYATEYWNRWNRRLPALGHVQTLTTHGGVCYHSFFVQ